MTLLLQKLLPHYRYVLVDLPQELASALPTLLHMPSTLLLVSDGGIASVREVARWREQFGANTAETNAAACAQQERCRWRAARKGAAADDPAARRLDSVGSADHGRRAPRDEGGPEVAARFATGWRLCRDSSRASQRRTPTLWKRIFG